MTANDCVTRALRWLNVIQAEESPAAYQTQYGLDTLNDMLHGFGPMGIAYAHTTLAGTDALNFPDEQIRNVTRMLAADLAAEYEVALSELQASQIVEAKQALQAAYMVVPPGQIEVNLLPRRPGRFSMRDG